jgi:carboxyl-terminal processing protease
MQSLVFDLRDNPGGLVREAVAVANTFLYKGQPILAMRGRSGPMRSREFAASNTTPDDYPLVVLVNGGTASASEIVAGALQDHDRAVIVGATSFGKGLVQTPFELEKDSGALVLTTQKYYTPSGRLIQRDYRGTSIYDYYLHRQTAGVQPERQVFRTNAGRTIYGGGGITPDIEVEIPDSFGANTRRWFQVAFMFTREVVNGQIKGLESYKVGALGHDHVMTPNELVVNDKYIEAFKRYVQAHPEMQRTAAEVERDREFLRNDLRRELAVAHFGVETSAQVTALVDPQVQRALRALPDAERMAQDFRKNRPVAAAVPAASVR